MKNKKLILGGAILAIIIVAAIFIINYDRGETVEETTTTEDKGAGNLIGGIVEIIGLG